jgi:hypothetical protein
VFKDIRQHLMGAARGECGVGRHVESVT